MAHVLELLVLVAVLFLGAAGWGQVVVRLCQRAGWTDAGTAVTPPLRIGIGVCLFLAVGGILVAVDSAWFWCLLLWHVVGCAALGWDLARHRRSWHPSRRDVAIVAGLFVILVLFVVIAVGNTFGGRFSWTDDIPGYMYLTNRLLATGGLIDPFNLRRVSSYGGSQLYDALVLRVSGASALQAFEFIFAPVLTVALVVMTTRRRWLVGGTALLTLGVVIVHPWSFHTHSNVFAAPLPVTNLSPEFSATALTLTVFLLAGLLRESTPRGQQALCVLIGVSLAGLLALRFTFVFAAAVAVIASVVSLGRRRALPAAGITLGAMAVSSIGWAVASFRSSGTPLVAVAAGNYNTHFAPAHDPLLDSVSKLASLFWKTFVFNTVGFVALASIVVAVALWIWVPGVRARTLVLLGAAVGCLVQLAVLTKQFNGAFPHDIARFEAPSTLACALYAAGILWPTRPPPPPEAVVDPEVSAPFVRDARPAKWAFLVVALGGLAVLTFGHSFSYDARLLHKDWRRGIRVIDGSYSIPDPYSATLRADYHRMNKAIPRRARVLAAVDDPGLLDFSRFQFSTLDFPGAASPPPHLPLFSGAAAVTRYLRSQGIDYVLADSPTGFGFYNRAQWEGSLKSPNWTAHHYAKYFLQWSSIVDSLEHDPGLHTITVQRLTLIELR